MVNLSIEDRQMLIALLQRLPELTTEVTRREILEYAGLRQLVPTIDLSPPTFVAVNQIVTRLSNYGRLTYEHEALGLFLNAVKSLVGLEDQEFISGLLIRYQMMTPLAPPARINEWRGGEGVEGLYEKIIGENTLRPISFLDQGLKVSRAVAYIKVISGTDRWSGTGFLISSELLITNNHVLPSADILPTCRFRFNYEETFEGEAKSFSEYKANVGGAFHTSEDLDYTIVSLAGRPGAEWGWLPLTPVAARKGERANIVQHPGGRPKEISFQNNYIEYVDDQVLQYVTSTQPGSSGSPVFDDSWRVVALHHAGGRILEPATQRRYFRNQGILITRILKDLPAELKARLAAQAAGLV